MHFSGGINRPPYETADGYLQTTEGCSHNHCLFCTYFKEQKFSKSTVEEIEADIKEIPQTFGAPRRIFLQGADGFAAEYDVLMKTAELLDQILTENPDVEFVQIIVNYFDWESYFIQPNELLKLGVTDVKQTFPEESVTLNGEDITPMVKEAWDWLIAHSFAI